MELRRFEWVGYPPLVPAGAERHRGRASEGRSQPSAGTRLQPVSPAPRSVWKLPLMTSPPVAGSMPGLATGSSPRVPPTVAATIPPPRVASCIDPSDSSPPFQPAPSCCSLRSSWLDDSSVSQGGGTRAARNHLFPGLFPGGPLGSPLCYIGGSQRSICGSEADMLPPPPSPRPVPRSFPSKVLRLLSFPSAPEPSLPLPFIPIEAAAPLSPSVRMASSSAAWMS